MDIEKDTVNTQEEATDLEDWSFVGDSAQHDLTLVVEEHKIHVSKAVLCVASPVFRAMFQSDFKEKNLQEVELPGKKYEDCAELLRCFYPDKLKLITETNVHQVLPLSVEYQVKVLQERCEPVLIEIVRKKHKTQEAVIKHLELAELYDMQDLRKLCIYIASEPPLPEQCFKQSTFKISGKALLQIHFLNYKRNQLNCQDDQELFLNGELAIRKEDMINEDSAWSYSVVFRVKCKDIITKYIESYTYTYRCMRLLHRYMPELLDKYKDRLQYSSDEEELSLLPESLKQLLNIPEDKRQYLYPPLPDVPQLPGVPDHKGQ